MGGAVVLDVGDFRHGGGGSIRLNGSWRRNILHHWQMNRGDLPHPPVTPVLVAGIQASPRRDCTTPGSLAHVPAAVGGYDLPGHELGLVAGEIDSGPGDVVGVA